MGGDSVQECFWLLEAEVAIECQKLKHQTLGSGGSDGQV